MDRNELARAKKVFGELTNNECFMRLKDDPIASRILETLLVKKELKELIELAILSEISYISTALKSSDTAQLVTAARSEYIAVIFDSENITCVYLAKLQ